MLHKTDAKDIAELFYLLDTSVRNDLHSNKISDERDYVSRLATHFNYPFGIFNHYNLNRLKFKSKWFSQVNKGYEERVFGCDSMIVFKKDNKIKVGLFEAKWARLFKDINYQWDYMQKSIKRSHFTTQIERQKKWSHCAAIWEMFFNESKVGSSQKPFDNNASSCVKHEFAQKRIDVTPSLDQIWNNDDLVNLIKSAQTSKFNGTNETNLREIVYDILTCKFGQPIIVNSTDTNFTLISLDNEIKVECPILNFENNNESEQLIKRFMESNGLSFFQQLDISDV